MATYTGKKLQVAQGDDTFVLDPISKLTKSDITALGIPENDDITVPVVNVTTVTEYIKSSNEKYMRIDATCDQEENVTCGCSVFKIVFLSPALLYSGHFISLKINDNEYEGMYVNSSKFTGQTKVYSDTTIPAGTYWCGRYAKNNSYAIYTSKDSIILGSINGYEIGSAISKDFQNTITGSGSSLYLPTSAAVIDYVDLHVIKPITISLDDVTNTSGSYTHTTNVATSGIITEGMKPIQIEVGNPAAFRDKITVTVGNDEITLSCPEVSGTSTVSVTLMRTQQASSSGVEPTHVTSEEFDILANRITDAATPVDITNTVTFNSDIILQSGGIYKIGKLVIVQLRVYSDTVTIKAGTQIITGGMPLPMGVIDSSSPVCFNCNRLGLKPYIVYSTGGVSILTLSTEEVGTGSAVYLNTTYVCQ